MESGSILDLNNIGDFSCRQQNRFSFAPPRQTAGQTAHFPIAIASQISDSFPRQMEFKAGSLLSLTVTGLNLRAKMCFPNLELTTQLLFYCRNNGLNFCLEEESSWQSASHLWGQISFSGRKFSRKSSLSPTFSPAAHAGEVLESMNRKRWSSRSRCRQATTCSFITSVPDPRSIHCIACDAMRFSLSLT